MKKSTKYILWAMPFLINLAMVVIIGAVAFYSHAFGGDTIWLYAANTDTYQAYYGHVFLTFFCIFPAIPFFEHQP